MHKIWANQHVQFYEAIFERPQAHFPRIIKTDEMILN